MMRGLFGFGLEVHPVENICQLCTFWLFSWLDAPTMKKGPAPLVIIQEIPGQML